MDIWTTQCVSCSNTKENQAHKYAHVIRKNLTMILNKLRLLSMFAFDASGDVLLDCEGKGQGGVQHDGHK